MTVENEYVSWQDFDTDCREIARRIQPMAHLFKNIFGVPRGGLVIAVRLAYLLDKPVTFSPEPKETLIVDDIADTGKTLSSYQNQGCLTATLYYHKQSETVPNIWIKEKTDRWIVFPWEQT